MIFGKLPPRNEVALKLFPNSISKRLGMFHRGTAIVRVINMSVQNYLFPVSEPKTPHRSKVCEFVAIIDHRSSKRAIKFAR